MMKQEVIFLIDSPIFERNIFSLTLEKFTDCRVFSFFSFEEALLYKDLNPSLVVYDSSENLDLSTIGENTKAVVLVPEDGPLEVSDKTNLTLKLATKIKNTIRAH